MIRVRICTMDRCHSSCADPDSPASVQILGKRFSSSTAEYAAHPGRSDLSASVLDSWRSRWVPIHNQSSVPPAVARTSAHAHCFHPTRISSLGPQITVEFLRCLAMLQSPLLQFPVSVSTKAICLKARMIIAPYNNHVGSFLRALVGGTTKVYPGPGADIVMESFTRFDAGRHGHVRPGKLDDQATGHRSPRREQGTYSKHPGSA